MSKPSPLIWLALILIFLLPTAAGRLILDLAGGLMVLLLLLPVLLGGLGWVGWRILQTRMIKCNVCGISTFKNANQCPICGSNYASEDNSRTTNNLTKEETIPASAATIDITAKDTSSE